MVGLHGFLMVGALVFLIGMAGVIGRKNLFIIFMSIELMLNAVILTLLAFARYHGPPPGSWAHSGQAMAFLILAVAAAEAAIGLAIVILVYRNRQTLNVDALAGMKE